MGFLTDYDYYYFTNSLHLGKVDNNEVRDTILGAVLTNNSIPQALQQLVLNGMGIQMAMFRNYAEHNYTLRFPHAAYFSSFILPEETIANIIAQDVGHTNGVQIAFQYTSPMVVVLALAPYFLQVRGCMYNNTVTQIPADQAKPVSHPEAVVTCTVESMEADETFSVATVNYKISEHRTAVEPVYRYWSEEVPIPSGLYPSREYYIVGYRPLGIEGSPVSDVIQWWYYDLSLDVYPEISPENSIDEGNNFLPVIPLRYRNEDMTREEVQDKKQYITSKKLLDIINVDIDEVAAKINENPDVGEIDYAYLMFGIDLQTEEIASLRYLVAFFEHVIDKACINALDFYRTLLSSLPSSIYTTDAHRQRTTCIYISGAGAKNPVTVTTETVITTSADGALTVSTVNGNPAWGSFEEFGLVMSVGYVSIRSEILTGSVGSIGHVTKTLVREADSRAYFKADVPEGSALVLCKQITSNTYKRITVFGLFHANYIRYPHGITTTLANVIDDPDNHGFIIPLHYNVVQQMEPLERSNVYADSFMLVLNSVKKVRVKWYQTDMFQFIFVASVTIVTMGNPLATAAAAGVMAVLEAIVLRVVLSIAISAALNLVASWVGADAVVIAAAVIATAAVVSGNPSMSITVPGASLPVSATFLDLSLALVSSANVEIQRQIGEVGKEQDKFNKEKEVLLEKLEEVEKLLPDTEALADVTNLLGMQAHSATLWQAVPGDPGKFYDLTIHTGNIGTLSLSGPSTFYDRALSLPEPDTRMMR